jgi:hypothetical protein
MATRAQQLLVLKKEWIMYFQIKKAIYLFTLLMTSIVAAQDITNEKAIDLGLNVAGDETIFFGAYGKFSMPLSQKKHHFITGVSLITYFDFKGESSEEAFLKDDIDMRIIPSIYLGYSLNFKKIQLNLEIPIGACFAITKGTLVNEKFGFERSFSNKEVFLNYGVVIHPKYQLNNQNYIGIYAFFPLIEDKAQSGYQYGIGWTQKIK